MAFQTWSSRQNQVIEWQQGKKATLGGVFPVLFDEFVSGPVYIVFTQY